MRKKLIGDLTLFIGPRNSRSRLSVVTRQAFVALEEFFDLQRVIGERLRRAAVREDRAA